MRYTIDLGNGTVLDVTKTGGSYVSSKEITEELFAGIKKVTITNEEGMSKTLKKITVEGIAKANGGWRFMLRELTDEELKEIARKKKLADQNEWIKNNCERANVVLPKGTKERITALGYTVNKFVNEAVQVMLDANES